LDYGVIKGGVNPHEYGHADHAFPTYESNLECGPVFNTGEQRDNATSGKIDVHDRISWFVQDLLKKQRDLFQARD
jgi:hypothetical protein